MQPHIKMLAGPALIVDTPSIKFEYRGSDPWFAFGLGLGIALRLRCPFFAVTLCTSSNTLFVTDEDAGQSYRLPLTAVARDYHMDFDTPSLDFDLVALEIAVGLDVRGVYGPPDSYSLGAYGVPTLCAGQGDADGEADYV